MAKTFKEHSRASFTEETITHEGIRTGAWQRMADALELIAQDRQKLIDQLDWHKKRTTTLNEMLESKNREINSNRSLITRYKNKTKKLEAELVELKELFNNKT